MKLQLIGKASSVAIETYSNSAHFERLDDSRALTRKPRYVPAWEWKGNTRRKGRAPELSRIGPGYVVRLNTGDVYASETTEEQDAEPLYKE